ncbi:hypothetical protein C0J52_08537 [Blattella germanica]|nr:hypothetical protein C0J52_08537 [Blattella germanica]
MVLCLQTRRSHVHGQGKGVKSKYRDPSSSEGEGQPELKLYPQKENVLVITREWEIRKEVKRR